MVESLPFQVVMRRPIFAALLSCRVDGPGALSCLPQSPVVSPCEWLLCPRFANIPKIGQQGSRAAGKQN